ncbi:hypothetical protein P389DRAFT_164868 [Cystobasidium minutum MCA 4210]|uniref:uncharacterized protein n=1 Tax=Cystobasidium minutum MCA 4210 TaxID=1397322 RepID=UPI0034CFA9EC|eukprot:jgi/Rhomi1/164868/fgenesh1_kg.1_\
MQALSKQLAILRSSSAWCMALWTASRSEYWRRWRRDSVGSHCILEACTHQTQSEADVPRFEELLINKTARIARRCIKRVNRPAGS